MPISEEAKLLLNLLNQQECFNLYNIRWDKFVRLSELHDLTPLTSYRLKDYAIPEETRSLLKIGYNVSVACNLKLWTAFLEIHAALQRKNIASVPLKGMDSLVRFYPELHLRSMADMDILVREEDLSQAEKILLEIGYWKHHLGLKEDYWRKTECHFTFRKSAFQVDLHWALDFKRKDRAVLPFLWQRIKEVDIEGAKINLLSNEDAILSLALNLRRFGNPVGLRQVRDASRIINAHPKLDYNYLLQESEARSICASLFFLLQQVELFTEAKLPSVILTKIRLSGFKKKLIKNFLEKNTFSLTALSDVGKTYLYAHFLLYDNFAEPIRYIINIPQEKFALFYSLPPYHKKTQVLYWLRFITIPLLQLLTIFKIKSQKSFHG